MLYSVDSFLIFFVCFNLISSINKMLTSYLCAKCTQIKLPRIDFSVPVHLAIGVQRLWDVLVANKMCQILNFQW